MIKVGFTLHAYLMNIFTSIARKRIKPRSRPKSTCCGDNSDSYLLLTTAIMPAFPGTSIHFFQFPSFFLFSINPPMTSARPAAHSTGTGHHS